MPLPDPMNPWTLIEQRSMYDCEYYTARKDLVSHRNGSARPYCSVRFKHFGAGVVPVDQEGCTVLVGQYRFVLDRFTWEIPRGGGTIGSSPEDVAKAELAEETGLSARNWLEVLRLNVSPGTSDERALGFVAWDLCQGASCPDQEEEISLWRLPFSQVVDMAISGAIEDMGSVSLILCIHSRMLRGELPAELLKFLRR